MKIVTTYWPKPVPERFTDWEATTEDYEPGMPIGFGATEEAAIEDLKQQMEMKNDLRRSIRNP